MTTEPLDKACDIKIHAMREAATLPRALFDHCTTMYGNGRRITDIMFSNGTMWQVVREPDGDQDHLWPWVIGYRAHEDGSTSHFGVWRYQGGAYTRASSPYIDITAGALESYAAGRYMSRVGMKMEVPGIGGVDLMDPHFVRAWGIVHAARRLASGRQSFTASWAELGFTDD